MAYVFVTLKSAEIVAILALVPYMGSRGQVLNLESNSHSKT